MKRVLLSAVLIGSFAAPLLADVTLTSTTTGKIMGMNPGGTTKQYIKGLKMRTDTIDGTRITSVVFDVEAQKMYSFDNRRKEADVWDMAGFADELSKTVAVGDIKASMKPNGQTKEIAGRTTNGYDVQISVPATVGGPGGMLMISNMTGTIWIAKGAPGSAEFSTFYRGAADKGFIFTDPRAAKGSPGQAKAMAEMYYQMAAIGGVPYESDIQIRIGGDGPIGMLGRIGNASLNTVTQTVEVGPLPDDLFAPPAGYKLRIQK